MNTLPEHSANRTAETENLMNGVRCGVRSSLLSNASVRQMRTKFKERLAYAMEHSGKTKAQISRETGIAYTQMWSWLTGGAIPRIESIVKLADACGVTIEYLARDEVEDGEIHN